MTDVEEIHGLLYRYCHAYDAGDAAGVDAIWAEDAVMATARGDQPRAALAQFSQTATGWKGKGRHLLHNPLVTIDGEHARFAAYWTVVGLAADGPSIAGTGAYRGEARKTASGWKITRWSPEATVMRRERLGAS